MIGRPWTAEAETRRRTSSGFPGIGWGHRRTWCRWDHAHVRAPPIRRGALSATTPRRASLATAALPRLRSPPLTSGEAEPRLFTTRSSHPTRRSPERRQPVDRVALRLGLELTGDRGLVMSLG